MDTSSLFVARTHFAAPAARWPVLLSPNTRLSPRIPLMLYYGLARIP
jgi:hypothetical protein